MGRHANLADPLTISAPFFPPLSFQHPPIPRKKTEKGARGRNLERLSPFTLNLPELIQKTLILLTGLPTHTLLCEADTGECCLPNTVNTLVEFFVLLRHSSSQSKYQRSKHHSSYAVSACCTFRLT